MKERYRIRKDWKRSWRWLIINNTVYICVLLYMYIVPSMPKVKAKVVWLMAISDNDNYTRIRGRIELETFFQNSTPKSRAGLIWRWLLMVLSQTHCTLYIYIYICTRSKSERLELTQKGIFTYNKLNMWQTRTYVGQGGISSIIPHSILILHHGMQSCKLARFYFSVFFIIARNASC